MNGQNYDYTQKATYQNRTDITLSVTSYIAAAVLYLYPVFVEGVKFIPLLQFLSLALIVVGIFVNQRYTWSKYVYRIKPLENKNSGEITGFSFLVYKVQGNKNTCLADIPCRDCIRLIKCTKKDKNPAELSSYQNPARYSFTQTLMPETFHTAVFRADGGIAIIRFEPDEEFVNILSALMDRSVAE